MFSLVPCELGQESLTKRRHVLVSHGCHCGRHLVLQHTGAEKLRLNALQPEHTQRWRGGRKGSGEYLVRLEIEQRREREKREEKEEEGGEEGRTREVPKRDSSRLGHLAQPEETPLPVTCQETQWDCDVRG